MLLFFSSFCVEMFMKWAIQVNITQIPRFQVDGFGCEKLTPRQGTIVVSGMCHVSSLHSAIGKEARLRIIQRQRRPTMHGWCFSLFSRRRILFIADIKFVCATAKTQVCHCNNGGHLSKRRGGRRNSFCNAIWEKYHEAMSVCLSVDASAVKHTHAHVGCCLCVKSQMPYREFIRNYWTMLRLSSRHRWMIQSRKSHCFCSPWLMCESSIELSTDTKTFISSNRSICVNELAEKAPIIAVGISPSSNRESFVRFSMICENSNSTIHVTKTD